MYYFKYIIDRFTCTTFKLIGQCSCCKTDEPKLAWVSVLVSAWVAACVGELASAWVGGCVGAWVAACVGGSVGAYAGVSERGCVWVRGRVGARVRGCVCLGAFVRVWDHKLMPN